MLAFWIQFSISGYYIILKKYFLLYYNIIVDSFCLFTLNFFLWLKNSKWFFSFFVKLLPWTRCALNVLHSPHLSAMIAIISLSVSLFLYCISFPSNLPLSHSFFDLTQSAGYMDSWAFNLGKSHVSFHVHEFYYLCFINFSLTWPGCKFSH